tara:strand:+ start:21498 stop:22553 length:1056 start_codon:yes stop_codon:yes gene_type:complete
MSSRPKKGTEEFNFDPPAPSVTARPVATRFASTPFTSAPFLAAATVTALILLLILAFNLGGNTTITSPQPESISLTSTEEVRTIEPEPTAQDIVAAPAEPVSETEPSPEENLLPAPAEHLPQLVIILDDIGNNLSAGIRAVQLPGAITLAVLPFTPHGQRLAEEGHLTGKEIMLHAPMSNIAGMDLGPDGLTLDLDETTLTERFRKAIADIPHIRGVNNHTGSELTAAPEPMQWVMTELKAQQLYFVDSMTTSKSVAGQTAEANNIPTLRRHVFLDNIAESDAIAIEFNRALEIAHKQGFAVAIGHPYPATLDFLEQALPDLADQGIQLVYVSDLLTRLARLDTTDKQPDN